MFGFRLADRDIADLEIFQALLPNVRDYIRQHEPSEWPEFCSILSCVKDKPLSSLAILPLASCAAVDGQPQEAVPVSAAWVVLSLAIRILDDLQDQDRSDALWAKIGSARSFNFSAALYTFCNNLLTQASWSPELYREISKHFVQKGLRLSQGQDQDLCGATLTVEEYWHTIECKNASAFVMACTAGAMCGTDNLQLLDAISDFGYHLGIALQLLDDFEGIWGEGDKSDLTMQKITLPVIYALNIAHSERDELHRLVDTARLSVESERVREILDRVNTRDFMIWTALQEHGKAINALEQCPGQQGVTALTTYATTVFTHVQEMLQAKTV